MEPKNMHGAWPNFSFHGNTYPGEFIKSLHKYLCANKFTAAIFMMGTNWKNSKCPTILGMLNWTVA